MKIRLHCFGPIYDYEFDLDKDFHLIVGENSVGKSYAATMVYLILKAFLSVDTRYYSAPLSMNSVEYHLRSPDILDQLSSIDEHKDKTVTDVFASGLQELLKIYFLTQLQSSVDATFDSDGVLKNQHTREDFKVEIESRVCMITLILKGKSLDISQVSIANSYIVRGVKTNRTPRTPTHSSGSRIIYNNILSPQHVRLHFVDELRRLFVEIVNEVFTRCATIHYLPASRSGLYQALSAFGQIVAELSKSRAFITRSSIELPSISEPLSDYFLKLSTITVQRSRFSDSKLDDVAGLIESDILGGKVEFDSKTKRIMFKPSDTSLRLDLSVTSSMVSELAPIVAYLRYILTEPTRRFPTSRKKETLQSLIIIEEPEAHLHPQVQVRLLEKFVALTRLGVKIVITSHSNYIFNKVSNLIIGRELPLDKVNATLFKMEEHGSIGKALVIDDYGIDDENFVAISESLFSEKVELIANHA